MTKSLAEIAKEMFGLSRAMSREYRAFAKLAKIEEDVARLQYLTGISKQDLQHHIQHGWTVKGLKMAYLQFGKLPDKCAGCELCEWMERDGQ